MYKIDYVETEFIHHEPCPNCGSKDNLARYSDGHGYCFGCEYLERADGDKKVKETKPVADLIELDYSPLSKRCISDETCRKWNYGIGSFKGIPVQAATYKDRDGAVVAQKLRFPNKDFVWVGNNKRIELWGMHLWRDGGKMVTVTEGEVDALTVSQLFSNKWPVVSIPNGAAGAQKSIAKHLDWLEKFETVVFCFDQDDQGRKAAIE